MAAGGPSHRQDRAGAGHRAAGGKLYFPWFSFWKSNPLHDKNLHLFITLVDEVLRDDPDLEDCVFEILDFCCPAPGDARALSVTNAEDIPRVSDAEKRAMLEIFAEGFSKARAILADAPKDQPPDQPGDDDRYSDDLQPDLFP